MANLTNYIKEKHTEFSGGSGIGYEMEQLESAIIDDTIASLNMPTISDLASFMPLENLRNDDEQTADDLLKLAVAGWVGTKCLDALVATEKFNVCQQYLETLTVCISLSERWADWLN